MHTHTYLLFPLHSPAHRISRTTTTVRDPLTTPRPQQILLPQHIVDEVELRLTLYHHHPLLSHEIDRLRYGIRIGGQIVQLTGMEQAEEVVQRDERPGAADAGGAVDYAGVVLVCGGKICGGC